MNKYSIPLAFACLIAIWSTTPLAIQWSSGNAPITSALLRMVLGVIFCALVMWISRVKLPFNRSANSLYLVSGFSIFGSMSLIYWAAQSIPSGWIAVLFGLSPLFTGLFSIFVEPESDLTVPRSLGIILGFFGLYLVFKAGLSINDETLIGVVLALTAVLISSASAVLIRHLSHRGNLSGMQITTGGLLVAIPLFAVTALLVDPVTQILYSPRAQAAILYLGLLGTGIGFSMYFFLLKNTSASKVSLVTLVTPITALLIGSWINNEPVIANVWWGGICVCLGLLLYQYKPRLGLPRL
ncbi:MAG: DMT family transporter [Gammaproteobacteria bacterium]|nr:DMT family transporter [Gammaproteobacteria bacterium]